MWARRAFTLSAAPRSATLYATGDDAVAVWVNGQQVVETSSVEQGWKAAQSAAIEKLLHAGQNVIAVRGVNEGPVGAVLCEMVAGGKSLLRSDASWKLLEAAAPPDNWSSPAFDDAAWPAATVIAPLGNGPWANQVNGWPEASNSAWYLAHTTLLPVSLQVLKGSLSAAEPRAPFTLSTANQDAPAQVLVDFGKEIAGRLVLRGSEGVSVKIRTGESREACFHEAPALDNGGPFELKLSAEKDAFTPYSAFRYALITLPSAQAVRFSRLELDHKYYPVSYQGSFSCSDPLLTRIWYAGAYTAHACMQEEIWDAPKRDRGLWSGDLLPTGNTIDVAFGDDFLMQRSLRGLRAIAQNNKPDQVLPEAEINSIPAYSATWITALANYHRYRGDRTFLKSQHKLLLSLLEFQKTDFDASNLFINPRNNWTFIDWSNGLITQSPESYRATGLMIIRGVHEAAYLLREMGDSQNAARCAAWAITLTEAARTHYADATTSTFGPRLQTNALAIYANVATPAQQDAIYQKILRSDSATWKMGAPYTNTNDYAMTPYGGFYVLQSLGELRQRQEGVNLIRRYWGAMMNRGATTLWEKFDPGFPDMKTVLDDMPYISLAHGWSSGPTSFLSEQVLGVRPTGAGMSSVDIAPFLGDLQWAQGSVPTPRGNIFVRAEKVGANQNVTVTLPPATLATVKLSGARISLNGKKAPIERREDGLALVMLSKSGIYRLSARN